MGRLVFKGNQAVWKTFQSGTRGKMVEYSSWTTGTKLVLYFAERREEHYILPVFYHPSNRAVPGKSINSHEYREASAALHPNVLLPKLYLVFLQQILNNAAHRLVIVVSGIIVCPFYQLDQSFRTNLLFEFMK